MAFLQVSQVISYMGIVRCGNSSMKNQLMRLIDYFKKIVDRLLYPMSPYWTANIYGFGKWVRRYGYYPPILPLCIYTDHGPGDGNSPYPHELNSDAPVQFYHAEAAVKRWKKISEKDCYVLYSPFVFARHVIGIEYNKDAKGSIYFAAHSTPSIAETKAVEIYHQEISNLPEKYHPVTICLHIHDVRKGLNIAYQKLGYRVVTAGDSLNQKFTENFYRILIQYKYALSNIFGSYALYAVEAGMPFGLYGSDPEYINEDDSNVENGAYVSYKVWPYYQRAVELFGELPAEEITSEQRKFVEYNLGLINGIGRKEMAAVLYKSLFVWAGNALKNIVKTKYFMR